MDVRVKIDEREFEGVVREHAGWLFGAAVRQLGDRGMAEDAVQVVFLLLARRAAVMKERERVAGWLFKTLGFTVRNLKRVEGRRRKRERAAGVEMENAQCKMHNGGEGKLEEMVGRLDEAVGRLPEKYREAILLRFYREVGFGEMAKMWRVKEAGARKRVERGLEMLRERLGEGVTESAVSACVVVGMGEMPRGLATSVVSGVMGGKVGVSAGVLAAAKGVNAMMMAAKVKMAVGVLAVVMMLTVGVGVVRLAMGEGVATSGQAVAKRFTISKESTGIVGPLHVDGTPDYVAAINAKYGAGVTTENNAYTAWVESVGSAPDPAIETPEYMKAQQRMSELSGAKIAGQVRWRNFGDYVLEKGYKGEAFDAQNDQRIQAMNHLWEGKEHVEVAGYLKDQAVYLDAQAGVWARARFFGAAVSPDGRSLISAVGPFELSRMVSTSQALLMRANMRMGSGDFAGFLSDVMTLKMMAQRRSQDWECGGEMGSFFSESMADKAIGLAAGSGRLNSEQCRALGRALDGMEPLEPIAERFDIEQRWSMLDLEILLATQQGKVLKQGMFENSYKDMFGEFEKVDAGSVDWDLMLRMTNEAFDRAMGARKAPEMDEMRLESKEAVADFAHYKSSDLGKRADEDSEAYTKRVLKAIMAKWWLSPEYWEVSERICVMRMEMARALVEAARFHAEKGRWASGWEELVPGYLKAEPVDVCARGGAAVVKYVVGAKGLYVYSVGKNGRDEGGVHEEAGRKDDVAVGVGE